MKFKLNKVLASLLGLTISMSVFAEDIELYVNHDVETDENPRVLMIFDTSGSMAWDVVDGGRCYRRYQNGQFYESDCFKSQTYFNYTQQCYKSVNGYAQAICEDSRLLVAKNAVSQLVTDNDDIDFGLMRFRESSGGYVLARLGSNKNTLLNEIDDLPASGATPLTETLWEAYRYITGQSLYYGYGINNRDKAADANGTYKSPFKKESGDPLRCDNSINIILMTDGDPTNDDGRDDQIKSVHNNLFNDSIPFVSGDYSNSYLVALSKIIHGTNNTKVDLYSETSDVLDTGRVFTIGFGTGMSDGGIDLLEKAASVGGGQYLEARTSEALSEALKNTISRIREVNDSFSSPSVASNNVDQTRSRDAVYFAMFYPETGARWRGNLKKLKVSGSQIVDSKGLSALDENGLIDENAETFWLPSGEPADGNLVAQGGVNLHLTTLDSDSRNLYTDNQGAIVNFNTSVVSDILNLVDNNPLSLSSDDIKWAMGVDVDDDDADGSNVDQRQDIFGDPLHSKPVAIDYGNDDIRVLIGTNAGFLHMFKDSDDSVSESWAFIPSALYDIIEPLRKNQADTKVYGMDGPISIYFDNKNLNSDGLNDGIIDASGDDRVWAFAGMRRGGKNYYGLDITNPNIPKKLWDAPIEGGKGDFKELAQTWSKPQIAYIKAFGDKPLLIFGAGYDTNKDAAIRSEDNIGRGIYIVEAETGKRVWALTPDINGFKGKHSIAADVTTLDSDYDGYIDRIYAADTGGDIWRIDMPGTSTSEFSHFKLAELGSNKATEDRRFFYKPLVARTIYSKVSETTIDGSTVITRLDTPYDAIVIGSGNRSKPTGTNEKDQLFMIRDENTVTKSYKTNAPDTIVPADLMQMNSDPFGNALDDVDDFVDLEVDLAKFNGWRYELGTGEKSLAAATVVGGVAYFTSFTPASDTSTENQCSLSGGGGSLYAFHLHYGTKVYDDLKFTTSYDVPDTPQLYFGEGASCVDGNGDGKCDDDPTVDVIQESQFYLIGPGIKGENAENPMKPVEIKGPGLTVVDGKVVLVNDNAVGFGFKTQQTYIYKREENDEVNN
ncbi:MULTISPECIES: PilC/PilY family type IV pilus protein [Pseudoalteromonas]|jgi:type IV pilus assembly protein PilY1|uniref:pilus assembly protein n=1 Tax=Pseudoalteromonas TaxID=53246 RepID=UPI00241ECECA|nr:MULTISPECIES: PilC/PilY family type IV pilus protein [Pseudoalteromonas]MDN3474997.1 PilC/PilY family type IV pilus protein [Pseudoalteromonas sp. APC 3355]|tara:strand:- start:12063 stop:15245 length:3183 start_codon:yes stop_codon:yes gene_type:complete